LQANGGGWNLVTEYSVKLWETRDWTQQKAFSFRRIGAPVAAFAPDGHYLAIEKDWDTVELHDIQNGSVTGTLSGYRASKDRPFSAGNLAFSPDSARVYQGAQNGVRAWNLQTEPDR